MKNYHLAPRCPHCLGDANLLNLLVNPPIELFECSNPKCPHYGKHRPVEELTPTPTDSGFDDPSNVPAPCRFCGHRIARCTLLECPGYDENYNLPPAWLGKPVTETERAMRKLGVDAVSELAARQAAEASFAAEQTKPRLIWGLVVVTAIVVVLSGLAVLGFIIFSK